MIILTHIVHNPDESAGKRGQKATLGTAFYAYYSKFYLIVSY